MIALRYWTTPNGHKITTYREEAGLHYRIVPHERQRRSLDDFRNLKRWFAAIAAHPAYDLVQTINSKLTVSAESRAHLFGQRARRP
jgi:glutathione S-transferase